ncbi:hypothetical protein D0X99_16385 [Algoriphagus lacus]|uniref:Alkaline phosphatase family protein n=1 Tax=Algoriphagus lacus TaxID=2056311 RepID=A0A418PNM3_9BACT|nr:alkaline phosphatase family protein [Algoriphagus lacus]RIW13353.1 hypothetical protein D0X99_16385 [Algoriphagus lacus]
MKISYLIFLLPFLVSVQSFGQPTPKVIVISIDGAADYILDELLSTNKLPEDGAFSKLSRKGFHADAMIPVNIAATAVAHTALFTGVSPGKNGVVGNSFLGSDDSISKGKSSSGFSSSVFSESIWSSAVRQGKKVININTVGMDGISESRKGTKTVAYGERLVQSAVYKVKPLENEKSEFSTNKQFEQLTPLFSEENLHYSTLKGEKIPLYVWAADQIINGSIEYQGIAIDFDSNPMNGFAGFLKLNEWTEIRFDVNGKQVSSWSTLMDFNSSGEASIYLGSAGHQQIFPNEFEEKLKQQIGSWPDEQDNRKLSQGLITEKMWLEQAERQAVFYKEQIATAIEEEEWDLISGYFTLIDDVQHRFLLTDERQLDFTLENGVRRQRYKEYVEWAYLTIDRLLLELLEKAPKDINFILVSDHGMAPIHSIALLNTYLQVNGIPTTGSNAKARAYSTGPAAHIYINAKKRFKDGLIDNKEYRTLRKKIYELCLELKDPQTSEQVFEVVAGKKKMKELGLFHPERSGDILVNAKVGWSISARNPSNANYVIPNSFNKDAYQNLPEEERKFLDAGTMNETGLGVHGNLGNTREMHAIFLGIGPSLPQKRVGTVRALDLVPSLSFLLGIHPPKGTEGKNIFN